MNLSQTLTYHFISYRFLSPAHHISETKLVSPYDFISYLRGDYIIDIRQNHPRKKVLLLILVGPVGTAVLTVLVASCLSFSKIIPQESTQNTSPDSVH